MALLNIKSTINLSRVGHLHSSDGTLILTELPKLTLLHHLRLSSNLGEVAALLVNIALTQYLESVIHSCHLATIGTYPIRPASIQHKYSPIVLNDEARAP